MIRIPIRLAVALAGAWFVLATLPFQPTHAQAPAGIVALTGARVIDGTGREPIEPATLLIGNGRVQAVGPSAAVQIPAGATRIDVSGKTIIPGLIDAHMHLSLFRKERETSEYVARWYDAATSLHPRDQLLNQLGVFAKYGVTTVVTLGETGSRHFVSDADAQEIIKLRDEQEQGSLDRARVYLSGPPADARTPEEGRKNVERLAAMKVDVIKIHIGRNTPPEVSRAIVDESHKRGLRVAVHITSLEDGKRGLDAGVDVIAHSVREQDVDAAFLAEMKRRNVPYVPTLTYDQSGFIYGTTAPFFNDPFFQRGMASFAKQVESFRNPVVQQEIKNSKEAETRRGWFEQAMRNLGPVAKAGIPIAMGTDGGGRKETGRWMGYFNHVELALMVEAGMTPMQTLVAATGNAARAQKLDGVLGTLQPGRWADFLVLNANPLDDIRNTQKIDSVWIAGRRLAN